MRHRPSFALPFLLLSAAAAAQSGITSGYGAIADIGFFDSCATICLRPGGLDDQQVNGGEFFENAAASLFNSGTENGFGSATFTGDAFSPLLRARARSTLDDNNAVDAIVTAIQGYTFMGASPETFTVLASLTGTVDQPDNRAEGVIRGRIAVYVYENATFSTDFATFIFEEVAGEGEVLDQAQLFLLPTLDLSEETLEFTLNPGDEVYVFMQLESKSERGAVVDATNTFGVSFVAGDAAMLSPTIEPLPELVFANGFETED